MQVRSLSLRNVRSYRGVDLTFGPGITLVAGDVGAGKTSLLYAVEMALFGFAEVDATYLLRHSAPTARVTLGIQDTDHRYLLSREFRRKSRRGRDQFELTDSSLTIDGKRTAYPATELRQRVIELLGFPDNPNPRAHSDFWRWAVYVPQEKMREVLDQNPEERLATIRKALGVEQYQTAAENAGEVARELRQRADLRAAEAERLRFFEEELGRATTELENQVQALAAIEQDEARVAELRQTLERTENQAREDRLRIESLRGQRRGREERVRDLGSRVTALETAQAQRKEELVRAEALSRARDGAAARLTVLHTDSAAVARRIETFRPLLADLESARREIASNEDQLREAHRVSAGEREMQARREAEAETLGRRLEELGQSGPKHRPQPPTLRGLSALDPLILAARDRTDEMVREVASAELEWTELDSLLREGVCPRCHQNVRPEEFESHRAELARILAVKREGLSTTREEATVLEAERASRERFERVLARWEDAEAHRATVKESLRAARTDLESLQGRARELDSRASALERRGIELRGKVERLTPLEAEVIVIEQTRLLAMEELADIAREVDRGRLIDEEARRLWADSIAAEEALTSLTQEQAEATTELARLDGALAESDAVQHSLTDTEARLREVESERRELTARRASAGSLAQEARRRIETAARGVADRRHRLEEGRRYRALADWMAGPFRESTLRLEKRLLARAQADFDRSLRRYFGTLVDDPSLVAHADAAFGPGLELDGTWTPPEALSGGERTALALAFRLSLGQVVRGLGHLKLETLILDEPTDGFSPEQVVRLGELLDDLGIPQILIVSHEPELAAIADRVIRVEKVGGESRVEKLPAGPGAPFSDAPVGPARPGRTVTDEGRARLTETSPAALTSASDENAARPTVSTRRRRGSLRDAPDASAR